MLRLANYEREIMWLNPIDEKETDFEKIEKAKDNLWFHFALRGRAVIDEIKWQKREWRPIDLPKDGMLYIVYAIGVYVGRSKAMKMYKNKEIIKGPAHDKRYITLSYNDLPPNRPS